MRRNYNYFYVQTSSADIQIEDTGNVILRGINLMQQYWILYIKTYLGYTSVFEYGPYVKNSQPLYYSQSSFQKFQYSEHKIDRIIDKFINNPKRMIIQVEEISDDIARDDIQPILEVFDESYQ